jgi:hypothetical protein
MEERITTASEISLSRVVLVDACGFIMGSWPTATIRMRIGGSGL